MAMAAAATFVMSVAAFAQTNTQTGAQQGRVSSANAQSTEANDATSTITVVGCLMNESDYRRAHGLGKGGVAGLRAGHDFVLVGAGPASTQTAASVSGNRSSTTAPRSAASGSCTENGTGEAYRLAGKREGELKSLVGRYVEITGRFEHPHDARIAAGEKQASLPAEIVVASYRETTPAAGEVPRPASAATQNQTAPSASDQTAPSAPVGTAGALPKTASAQPLIALIALLCLSTAVAVRLVRRRAL